MLGTNRKDSQKTIKKRYTYRKLNRSRAGSAALFAGLFLLVAFTLIPIAYALVNAFKPLDELWLYPPPLYVRNPTLKNFRDLVIIMGNSWVPLSRYLFNTVFVTVVGTVGNIILSSMCAYPLAKDRFPGSKIYFKIVVLSLMFNSAVTAVPNYLIIKKLGWLNTYASVIVPAMGSSLGLFLMKQFMEQLPNALIEAAKIDGASQISIFWRIVMPNVRPAWLTLSIFSVQSLWNLNQTNYIYTEKLKTLSYALSQIGSSISRAGVSAAITVMMMIVPVTLFVLTQKSIIQTMTTAGIKE